MERIYFSVSDEQLTNRKIEYGNLFFCFALSLQAIMTIFCKTIRLFIPNTRSLDTLFIYGLFAIVFLKALPQFKLKVKRSELCVFAVYLFMWIYAEVIMQDPGSVRRGIMLDIAQTCLLAWLAGRVVHLTPKLLKYLRITGYIFVLRFFMDLSIFSTSNVGEIYSQYAGNQLYIGFCLLLTPLLIERRWYDFLIAAFSILANLITGARGPFIFAIAALVFCIFVSLTERKKFLRLLPLIIVLITIVAININTIMNYLLSLALSQGGSTRTIQTILDGRFFSYLSGREQIFPIAWDYIMRHPIYGLGFANDRIYISSMIQSIGAMAGNYPHNILLEIGMNFGLIPGLLVVVYFVRLFVRCFKTQKIMEDKVFFTALLCGALLPLLVSGSYITSPMFYMLIAFCHRITYTRSSEKKQPEDIHI